MPRFEKGSQQAKDYMRQLREKRGQPKPEGYIPKPKKEKKPVDDTFVKLQRFGKPELAVPEFFVVENTIKHTKGKNAGTTETTYKLANPLTKTRHLASRQGKPSIRILRKTIDNMVLLSKHPNMVPLSLFSAEDQETIKRSFDMVEEHRDDKYGDIPTARFENKTRGRPELLSRNIAENYERQTAPPVRYEEEDFTQQFSEPTVKYTTAKVNAYKKSRGVDKVQKAKAKKRRGKSEEEDEEEDEEEELPISQLEATQSKSRGRKPKYATEEERKEALRIQKRDYMRRKTAEEKKKTQPEEGKGIIKSIKKSANKLSDYGKAIIYGRNDYQPKVRNILEQYGDKVIRGIRIKRTPVPSLFTHIMGTISQSFSENLSNAPYDDLYHLYIGVSLDDGSIISIEKNEVINMDVNPQTRPQTEEVIVIPIPPNMTILSMMEATHKYMGNSFFKYSAKSNNCQDFILAIFDANGIGDEDDRIFIKQDTKALFQNTGPLSKITDTITNLGCAFNAFTQGTGVIDEYGQMVSHLTTHITDPNEPVDPRDYKQATHLIKKIKQLKEDSNSDSDSDSDIDSDMDGGKITPSYVVQSVVFDTPKYKVDTAVRWLKHNGYKAVKADIEMGREAEAFPPKSKLPPTKKEDTARPPMEQPGTIRFRQMSPKDVKKMGYTQYRTKSIIDGITLVLVYKEAKIKGGELWVPEVHPTRWQPHMNEAVVNKKSMSGGRLVKGSSEAKEYMRKMRERRGKKGKGVDTEAVIGKVY